MPRGMRVEKPQSTVFQIKECPDVEKIMFMTRSSMAKVVSKAVQEYVQNHKDMVEAYDKIFGGDNSETKFSL